MYFILLNKRGYTKGSYSYFSKCEIVYHVNEMTQDILDKYNQYCSNEIFTLERINRVRWIMSEMDLNDKYDFDFIMFFNDSIPYDLKYTTYENNMHLENLINEYKISLRDEKIKNILN